MEQFKKIQEKIKEAVRLLKKDVVTDKETLEAEIDLIKNEFGWSEHEILSLPVTRRKSYVRLLQSSSEG